MLQYSLQVGLSRSTQDTLNRAGTFHVARFTAGHVSCGEVHCKVSCFCTERQNLHYRGWLAHDGLRVLFT